MLRQDTRTFFATGQTIPALGVGCWQLGGKGWGKCSTADLRAAIEQALAQGLRLFDTAPIYGFGESERVLGKLLAGRAEEALVISKGGLVWDLRKRVRHDNTPATLRRQLETSLRHLRRDTLDVFLLHWPDPSVPLEESAQELERCRQRGLLRSWGLSNFSYAEVTRWRRESTAPIEPLVVELPLNLLRMDAQGRRLDDSAALLAEAGRQGWDAVVYDVLARGLLGGTYEKSTRFGKRDVRQQDARFEPAAFAQHLQCAARLRELATDLGTPTAVLALRAALDYPGVTAAVVGMKSPEQVNENVKALELKLPEAVRRELHDLAQEP